MKQHIAIDKATPNVGALDFSHLLDAPAGLGGGFRMSVCGADRALVVSTTDTSALRDAQRTVCELSRSIQSLHLVVNRVQPRLLRRLHTTIDDAMDAAGLPIGMQLIGGRFEEGKILRAAYQYEQAAGPILSAVEGGVAL